MRGRAAAGAGILALALVLALGAPLAGGDAPRATGAQALIPLQPILDAAEEKAEIVLKPGRYAGPAVITKPLVLDGANAAIVDARGKGTVLLVKTSSATVRNLHLTGSGDQHNDIDAGLRIEGNFNVVKDVTVTDSLFGIDLQEAHNNVVRRNRVVSKADIDLGVKGDAIRLWYARHNRIEENEITGSRDLVMWYSDHNTVVRNAVSGSRYGLHLMYAHDNIVEENRFDDNAVGIYLMYSDRCILRKNRLFKAQGAAGVGIGLKEASDVDVEDNEVLYNAVGLAFDISPFQPGSQVRVHGNKIAFNDIGVSFLSDRPGNVFKDNQFLANTQQVAMRLFESARQAEWDGNYWDDYEGFDLDKNGFGDTPHAMRSYADRLWMDVPAAALFKGSPALTALDFIERLAPFTEPLALLTDVHPRMSRLFTRRPVAPLKPAQEGGGGEEAGNVPDEGGSKQAPGLYDKVDPATGRIDPFGLNAR